MAEYNVITLHFNTVEGNRINATTLTASITAIEQIVTEFVRLHNPEAEIEIQVKPPTEGCFIIEIVIGCVSASIGVLIVKIITDYGMGWIEGILGRTVKELGKEHGSRLRGTAKGAETDTEDHTHDDVAKGIDPKDATKLLSAYAVEKTTGILEKPINKDDGQKEVSSEDADEIKGIAAEEKAIKAKSDLFKALKNDKNIKSVKLSKDGSEVKKTDFHHHQSPTRNRKLKELSFDVKARIIRAVTDESTRRQWELRILSGEHPVLGETFYVFMEDKEFLENYWEGDHPLRNTATPDIIEARVEVKRTMKGGNIKNEHKAITEIHTFNGKKLADIESSSDENRQ